jgi:N-acetylmuramoyl-L-alanine amidase
LDEYDSLGHRPDPVRAALLLFALLVAVPEPAHGAPRRPPSAARPPSRSKPGRHTRAPALAEAKAAMAALQRDRSRRRFRHNWERAILNLERSARGRDASAAWLEAARARYALFRWSANDADREAALALAARAARAGSRQAPALAAAIRREAGDDRPAPRRRPGPKAPAPPPVDEDAEEAEGEAEPPADPALAAALADLSAAAGEPLRAGTSTGEGPAQVTEVKSWSSGEYTRVAIYLSRWVGWQRLELPALAGAPRRLALDFRPAELDRALAQEVEGRQVDRVRAAQNDPETVRVVLDLPGSDGLHLFALHDPPRLIVDVGSPEARPQVAAAPERAGAAETPLPPPPPPPAAPGIGAIRRVVVDAGHGGRDPGAIGPGRVREKDVTLGIARRLASRLREAGFEVVLTRDRDRTLALEERTALANGAGGDLFVSVHANAHPRRHRAGIETYFLDVANDRYAARLAERENGIDLGEGDEQAARILTDLDAKASASTSRRLGALVQREVTAGVRSRIGPVRDLGVKGALFYVLLGARMPAVLVETGFISNREEEGRLSSEAYRDEVASGIARAVVSYARSDARVAAAR